LAALVQGRWRYSHQAEHWAGIPIAAALGINIADPGARKRIKNLIDEWLTDGSLVQYEAADEKRRPRAFIRPVEG
jgi:hypothetical protein